MSLANALRFNYQVCTRKCAKYILLRGQVRTVLSVHPHTTGRTILTLAYKTPKKVYQQKRSLW
jgi:hypothetical protein